MTIMLVTGLPGAGKTAKVVDLLAHDPQFKGRPLFQMGIPELLLDHEPTPPVSEWVEFRDSPEDESLKLAYFTFPAHAVVVVDEAQRVYRPRPAGSKVPPEVAAFETHRHTGVDFILLTQHPNLLDSNVRKLIGRHWHVHVTSLGRYLLDWPRLGDVESSSDRDLATRERYKPPKRVFSLYKSAEAHTKIKRKLPWFFWVFMAALLLAIGGGWYAWQRVASRVKSPDVDLTKPAQIQPGATPDNMSAPAGGSNAPRITKAAYYAEREPRLEGLHHTAPVYDEITKPTQAPFPTGCIKFAKYRERPAKCVCHDQQGNDYATTPAVCENIVAHGLFREFTIAPTDRPEAGRAGQGEKRAATLPVKALKDDA